MSKKRKKTTSRKKVSQSELNRIRRKAEMLEKKAFFQTLDNLTADLGIKRPIRERLGEDEMEYMFFSRFRKPILKSVTKLKIPQKPLKLIQETIDGFLNNNFFQLPGGSKEFSYYEYFTCFLTLKSSISTTSEDKNFKFKGMAEDYKVILKLVTSEGSPEIHFLQYLAALGNCLSYPTKFEVQLTNKCRFVKSDNPHIANDVEINICPIQGRRVLFQDQLQTVFPLQIQTSKRCNVLIPASALYPKSAVRQAGVNLYFQEHSIARLMERIDCMSEVQIFESLHTSFLNPKVIKMSGSKFLVSYYVDGIKLGYFVLIVSEGIAVVKTFLFLTNDGTPEGNMLNNRLNMSKHEKKHFSLDKLSSFYYSNIDQDEVIRDILIKSGCSNLVGLKKRLKILSEERLNLIPQSLPTHESIRNYIQLENVA
ncbi:MAG: hypothetical protein AAFQ94_15620 [Bacteroidota bacterium]